MSKNKKIEHIIDQWFLNEPLLFNTYCTHKLEENPNMRTMFRTGHGRIEYNPQLVNAASSKKVEEELRIEISRILLKHPYQRVPAYPKPAALGLASDVTLNDCMDFKNLKTPKYYNLESGLSYEEYYNHISKIVPNQEQINNGAGEESSTIQQLKKASETSGLWQEDESMVATINKQIEKAVKSKQWGSFSGREMQKIVASMKIPMDYRRILAQFRSEFISSKRKLTRMKPSRRYGFEFMGSKFEPESKLLVACDVSGSISSKDIQRFLSIINRFFSYGVKTITVLTFDTIIQQQFELKKAKSELQIIGRGGTSFQPVINFYEADSSYKGLIIFTDGYSFRPYISKKKKVLWILSGKAEYDDAKPWISTMEYHRATWIPRK